LGIVVCAGVSGDRSWEVVGMVEKAGEIVGEGLQGGKFELGKVGKGHGNSVEWWGSAGIRGSGLVRCGGKTEDALWAFRTAYRTPIGCTAYKLVYGKACHLPMELEHKAYWALKQTNFNLNVVGDHRKIQLNELNELRNQAYENS
nr:reverse transcriptase domain-containing protein [Tanacetum cinerariifolium]